MSYSMMKHKILKGNEAREKLAVGIRKVAEAVIATLGPRGRNVIIQTGGLPAVTKDGVTVAQSLQLPDAGEAQGATLAVQASINTNEKVGDGTTTSMALVLAVINRGLAVMTGAIGGLDLQAFREGLQTAVKDALADIKKETRQVKSFDSLKQIATVSANNNEAIGKLVAETVQSVGDNGIVTVEESQGKEIEIEKSEGTQFDKGMVSPYMITNVEDRSTTLKSPDIILSMDRIDSAPELFEFLNAYVKETGKKEMVVVAEDFGETVINSAVANRLKSLFTLILVRSPGYGDRKLSIMQDLALLTGATLLSYKAGPKLSELNVSHLGKAEKISLTLDDTVIIGGYGKPEAIASRVKEIETEIKNSSSEFDKTRLKERIGKLLGKVACIKVGGTTEAEAKELKYLVEDSVSAVRAAMRSGITAGGGVAMLRAYEQKLAPKDKSVDFMLGYDILYDALKAPITHIVTNCGQTARLVEELMEKHKKDVSAGYDGKNDVVVKDMFEAGIVDPYEVAESALSSAASVAFTVISTEILAYEYDAKDDEPPTRS